MDKETGQIYPPHILTDKPFCFVKWVECDIEVCLEDKCILNSVWEAE